MIQYITSTATEFPFSGYANGATGDVAVDQYHKYKVHNLSFLMHQIDFCLRIVSV